jgi:predicted ribosome quality control (RQC) complex YloA/Tae2 family protein
MTFDGFFIYHLIQELNVEVAKSRLEKIYQIDDQAFLFVVYLRGERKYLLLNLSPSKFGLHLTKKHTQGQATSQFLQTLKKHLEGAILDQVKQYQTDRVIELHFTVYDFIDGPISKVLIFEAMGKHSNLLLIKDMIIIDTFKKMFFEEGRQLLPQAQFEYFPSDKKLFTEMKLFDLESPKHLVNHYMGISTLLANYLCEHPVEITKILVQPTRDLTIKKDYVFDIFDPTHEKRTYPTLSLMMDDDHTMSKNTFFSHQQFIEKQIKKYEKKAAQLELLLDEAHEGLSAKHRADMIYQLGIDLKEKRSDIEIDGLKIMLDSTKSLSDNAQHFYKAYQKSKRGIEHIQIQQKDNQDLLTYFIEMKTYISLATADQLKEIETELSNYGFKGMKQQKYSSKHKSAKPNILKLEEQDYFYYIGKNNIQNEYLTHELAQKEHYWFHVKDAAGAHVIVTAKHLNEHILRKACMLAAYYSSMRYSSSIPVDYTQIKYIKKISGLPGFKVTYTKHQTMYIDIDEQKIESFLKKV